jgi:hypothetical protein
MSCSTCQIGPSVSYWFQAAEHLGRPERAIPTKGSQIGTKCPIPHARYDQGYLIDFKQLNIWGDLSVPWNNATATVPDAFLACGYGGSIINNVILPNHPDTLMPWPQPIPQGVGPQGEYVSLSSCPSILLSAYLC